MRLGVNLSPHFAHVLVAVADSAKIYFASSILRVFLAKTWASVIGKPPKETAPSSQ